MKQDPGLQKFHPQIKHKQSTNIFPRNNIKILSTKFNVFPYARKKKEQIQSFLQRRFSLLPSQQKIKIETYLMAQPSK